MGMFGSTVPPSSTQCPSSLATRHWLAVPAQRDGGTGRHTEGPWSRALGVLHARKGHETLRMLEVFKSFFEQ